MHCRRSAGVEDDDVPGLNKGAVDEGCVSVVDGVQWLRTSRLSPRRGGWVWLPGYHAAQMRWQRTDCGETSRVMVVSTAVVRMGEGVCVDGGEWTRLTGYHAIDGRTEAVSATDGGRVG